MKGTAFSRRGLGYALVMDQLGAEISCGRLSKSRGEFHAMLKVSSALHGVRAVDGILFNARENLSSDASRKRIAKGLAERTQGVGIDWLLLIDEFCLQVLASESRGVEAVRVGAQPQSIGIAWALEPIVPARMTTILFGDGSAGKSTLAVAMGVSVQTGIQIIPGWKPRQANVLYLDWETWDGDLDAKVKQIAAGAEIEDDVTILYRSCSLPLADELESLSRIIAAEHIGMVIVDSAGLAAGVGDGDFADSAFRLFACFRELGVTVLLIDHITKGDASDPNRPSKPYGSAYKGYLARCTYEVRRDERADGKSSLGIFTRKYNIGRAPLPVGLSVEFGDGVIRYEKEELSGELTRSLSQPQRIYSVLRDGPLQAKEIADETGIEENAVRSVLSRDHGARFKKLDDGRWSLREARIAS